MRWRWRKRFESGALFYALIALQTWYFGALAAESPIILGQQTRQLLGNDKSSTSSKSYQNCANEKLSGTKGSGYRGCQTKTKSGLTCQRWDRQSPHKHSNHKPGQTYDAGPHNYCRNPDGSSTIWCYTTSSSKRWEYCVPFETAKSGELVVFQSLVGVSSSAGVIKRTKSGSGWHAGAVSQRAIKSATDTVRGISAVCDRNDKYQMIGLNSKSTSSSYSDIDFAMYCRRGGSLYVYEKGSSKGKIGTYSAGATIQVVVSEQGKVQYHLNRKVLKTSSRQVVYPLYADVAIHDSGGSFSNVHWIGRVLQPPPPPPPSPPPPGRGVDVKFEVGDPMDVVSSYAYDFRIKVKHPSCDDKDDCLAPEDEKHTNQRNGLRCDITVQPEGKTCSTFSKDSLPCRRWRISYPTRRLDSIEMSDKDGKLASGKYEIRYSCWWEYRRCTKYSNWSGRRRNLLGNGANGAARTTTSFQNRRCLRYSTYLKVPGSDSSGLIHKFRVLPGCNKFLPLSGGGDSRTGETYEELAKYLLLTADEFNTVLCDKQDIYAAKELVFRKHDNNPRDGILSFEELYAAIEKQSADTYILDMWNKAENGDITLMPSHLLMLDIYPAHCAQKVKHNLQFTSTVYPTSVPGRETLLKQCEAEAKLMRVGWEYNLKAERGTLFAFMSMAYYTIRWT